MRRTLTAFVITALAAASGFLASRSADAAPAPRGAAAATSTPRSVMYIGNNWDGTANVVDSQTFAKVGRVNVVPDYAERMAEIQSDPERLAYYLAIRQAIGEGHDQLVDDMFSTPDGTLLAVS